MQALLISHRADEICGVDSRIRENEGDVLLVRYSCVSETGKLSSMLGGEDLRKFLG
jgi:hypothetical protein